MAPTTYVNAPENRAARPTTALVPKLQRQSGTTTAFDEWSSALFTFLSGPEVDGKQHVAERTPALRLNHRSPNAGGHEE